MKKLLVVMLSMMVMLSFTACSSEAKKTMKDTVKTANELLDENKTPFDKKTKTDLKKAVESSEEAKDDDAYEKTTKDIKSAMQKYKDSIEQLKQVTNPKESFLLERAKTVDTITDVEAATEETDGNGMMNKDGGYYAYIALKSTEVSERSEGLYDDEGPVEAGNSGGAAIEAFKTVKEAKKRNKYLSTFDGQGILDPGSHTVVGTLVVRTSNELTATQQKNLEKNIINALIKLK